ncbi:MAG: hypothetical protein Q9207_000593 [Kuettlingeria erythrocarpa]
MGLAERIKDVSDTDCAAYGQGVGLNIITKLVEVREIDLDPIGSFVREIAKPCPPPADKKEWRSRRQSSTHYSREAVKHWVRRITMHGMPKEMTRGQVVQRPSLELSWNAEMF